MYDKWDLRFLKIAKEVSMWSLDPSTKIGSVIVKDRRILSTGYNGFPRNIEDTLERLSDRESKYKYMVHGELNAILNASYHGISLCGATAYVYGLPPCVECSKAIIQSGISVVVSQYAHPLPERWNNSYLLSKEIFEESNIEYKEFEINTLL